MKTVLNLKVENYNVVVTKETRTITNSNQVGNETGFTWSVSLNGVVKSFCTIVYNEQIYTPLQVASNAINWIANQEKTSKQRFAKADELKEKYLLIN